MKLLKYFQCQIFFLQKKIYVTADEERQLKLTVLILITI